MPTAHLTLSTICPLQWCPKSKCHFSMPKNPIYLVILRPVMGFVPHQEKKQKWRQEIQQMSYYVPWSFQSLGMFQRSEISFSSFSFPQHWFAIVGGTEQLLFRSQWRLTFNKCSFPKTFSSVWMLFIRQLRV